MIRVILITFFAFSSLAILAQDRVNGKIYGDKAVAKFIKVLNTTKNINIFCDENGNFSIKASVGDSIIFSSTFYKNKRIIIDDIHFSETVVIQLKDKINELDEVLLKENLKEKKFSIKTYNEELKSLIENDIENNPQEYKPKPKSQYGINLLGFIDLAKKLLPKKEKKEKKKTNLRPRIISYYDLIKLKTNDEFFSDEFFTKDLKIHEDLKYSFFEFFEDQKINSELLSLKSRLLLTEKFFEVSEKFLNIVNQKTASDNKTLND